MKKLLFLCLAAAIFVFSVLVLNFAPTINGLVGKGNYDMNGNLIVSYGWADFPCNLYSDRYNDYKETEVTSILTQEDKDNQLNLYKEGKNNCLRKKAMIGLEYSAFNFNIIIGFLCTILGIIHFSGNNLGKIVGIIGLASGAIGFVLTFVYIIYSGIIFNNDVVGKEFGTYGDQYDRSYLATKPDGSFMEWKDGKYVCIFYDKDNKDKLYRKYSNYGNKYLNYYHLNSKDKDDDYYKYRDCSEDLSTLKGLTQWENCKKYAEGTETFSITGKWKVLDENGKEKLECEKIYAVDRGYNVKKNLYNYWVTTIVLGCFIFVFDIGLAIFGFLLFKDNNGTPL